MACDMSPTLSLPFEKSRTWSLVHYIKYGQSQNPLKKYTISTTTEGKTLTTIDPRCRGSSCRSSWWRGGSLLVVEGAHVEVVVDDGRGRSLLVVEGVVSESIIDLFETSRPQMMWKPHSIPLLHTNLSPIKFLTCATTSRPPWSKICTGILWCLQWLKATFEVYHKRERIHVNRGRIMCPTILVNNWGPGGGVLARPTRQSITLPTIQ